MKKISLHLARSCHGTFETVDYMIERGQQDAAKTHASFEEVCSMIIGPLAKKSW